MNNLPVLTDIPKANAIAAVAAAQVLGGLQRWQRARHYCELAGFDDDAKYCQEEIEAIEKAEEKPNAE